MAPLLCITPRKQPRSPPKPLASGTAGICHAKSAKRAPIPQPKQTPGKRNKSESSAPFNTLPRDFGHAITSTATPPRRKAIEGSARKNGEVNPVIARTVSQDISEAPCADLFPEPAKKAPSIYDDHNQYHGKDFRAVRRLNAGAEGEVVLVEHGKTQKFFAVKTVVKPDTVGGKIPRGK